MIGKSFDDVDIMMTLTIASTAGSEEALETMEKIGQNKQLNKEQLPVDGTPGGRDHRSRDEEQQRRFIEGWEATGIVFEEYEGRAIWRNCTLPYGWKFKRTDPMWSDLVDAKGRARARMFHKSSLWENEAFIDIQHRYKLDRVYFGDSNNRAVQHRVLDGDKVLFESEIHDPGPYPKDSPREARCKYHDTEEAFNKKTGDECVAWLDEHYPRWREPAAYWED